SAARRPRSWRSLRSRATARCTAGRGERCRTGTDTARRRHAPGRCPAPPVPPVFPVPPARRALPGFPPDPPLPRPRGPATSPSAPKAERSSDFSFPLHAVFRTMTAPDGFSHIPSALAGDAPIFSTSSAATPPITTTRLILHPPLPLTGRPLPPAAPHHCRQSL